jgi:hypothetical protein
MWELHNRERPLQSKAQNPRQNVNPISVQILLYTPIHTNKARLYTSTRHIIKEFKSEQTLTLPLHHLLFKPDPNLFNQASHFQVWS